MTPRAPIEYATPSEVREGVGNHPQKTVAGDSIETTIHPNSRSKSETQDTITTMAETGNSPKTETNTASALEPKAVVSETKCDTFGTKDVISSSESKDTTTDSSQTSAEPDGEAAGVDVEIYGQFKEEQIASDEENERSVMRTDWMPLDKRRKLAGKRARQSSSYLYLLEDRVAYLESQIIKWKPEDPIDEDAVPPVKLMRREPNRMSFAEFELARLEEGEHVLDIQINDPAVGEAIDQQRAEKLRINSVPVLKILEKLTTKVFGNSYIFLRPFRFLMRQRELLEGYMKELEKMHCDKDADSTDDKSIESTAIYGPEGEVWGSHLVLNNLAPILEAATENMTETKEDLEDLRCLLKFIDEECKSDFDLIQAIKHGGVKKIAFQDIDLLFTAGEEIYSQKEVDNPQVYRVLATTGGRPLRKTEFILGNYKLYSRIFKKHQECEHNFDPDYNDIFRARKDSDGKGESLYRRHDTASPFIIDCYSIDFDGLRLGGVQKQIEIRPYEGEKPVTSLPVYPLKFLPDLGKTRERLLHRGRSFLQMLQVSHKYYEGLSLSEPKEEIQSQVIADPTLALQLNPKWVIKLGFDTATERDPREANESGPSTCATLCWQGSFCKKHDDFGIELQTKRQLEIFAAQAKLLDEAQEQQKPPDALVILLPQRIFGFVLRSRKWAPLDVTLMKDVPSRKEGFDSLVLPKGHRDLVEALVKTHSRGSDSKPTSGTIHEKEHEVDLVRGKGKGLIILLHGAPGVGKTSTAECVADYTGRPLFAITCGDIGAEAKEVEENLEKHFYLAHKWGCVLLLDEADIFLQKRDKADLRRNSLVSAFLRVLEYYSGILFLTTNRVGMFDEAFKSRIHISLYYPPLDRKAYLAVWDMNLKRTQDGKKNIQVDRDEIRGYAKDHYKELKWNGRQIRNAFQTAIALAEFDAKKDAIKAGVEGAEDMVHPKATLTYRKFAKVAKASRDFEEYLQEVYSGFKDADIAERDELRKDDFSVYPPQRRSTFNRNKKEETSESEEDSTDSGEDEDDSDSEDQDEDSESDKKRKEKRKRNTRSKKPKRGGDDSDDSEEEEEEARKRTRKKTAKKGSKR